VAKKAVSLTLDEANVLWLRGRASGHGNLSAVVDDLITEARTGRLGDATGVRSVVGTIDIAADDPRLDRADNTVRELFAASLARPSRVRGTSASCKTTGTRARRRG